MNTSTDIEDVLPEIPEGLIRAGIRLPAYHKSTGTTPFPETDRLKAINGYRHGIRRGF